MGPPRRGDRDLDLDFDLVLNPATLAIEELGVCRLLTDGCVRTTMTGSCITERWGDHDLRECALIGLSLAGDECLEGDLELFDGEAREAERTEHSRMVAKPDAADGDAVRMTCVSTGDRERLPERE